MQPNQQPRPAAPAGQPAACAGRPQQPAALPPAPPRPIVSLDKKDGIFALVTLVLGYLFLRLISLFFAGAGISLFTLCYLLVVLLYARRTGRGPARASRGWGGFLLLFSLLFLKGVPDALTLPALVFLCALAAYWTLAVFGVRIGGRLDGNFAVDLFNALLRVPFSGFDLLPRAVAALLRQTPGSGEKPKKKLLTPEVLLGGLLTLLLLPPVLLLLAQADEGFTRALRLLFGQIQISPDLFVWIVLSIPVSLYFFGLFAGGRYRLHLGPDPAQREKARQKRQPFGFAVAAIPTGALLVVYLLFLVAQLPYFFSAFAGLLPAGFTYAGYARRGFFELIFVAAINLGLLLFAKCCTQKSARGRKLLSALLCGATLLLLVTAARKLLLYIGMLGLTRLRIWAGWAMLLVAVTTLLFLLDEFHPLPLMRVVVLFFCGWFFLLCAVRTEPLTLRYNYTAWRAGEIEEFDLWQGEDVSAIPVLCEILRDADEDWIRQGCTERIWQGAENLKLKQSRPLVGFTLEGMVAMQSADQAAADGLMDWGFTEQTGTE